MTTKLGLVIGVAGLIGCGAPERPPVDDLGMCPTPGWCWLDPTPQGNGLRASWGSARDDVWMVGDNGTVLHFDGAAWTFSPSATHDDLTGVWGSAADDVWAWGPAALQHWDGAAWELHAKPDGDLVTVWQPPGADIVWASTSVGTFRSDGVGWAHESTSQPVTQFAGGDATDIWAAGTSSLLHWDGAAWSPVSTLFSPERIVVDNDGTVWSVGSDGAELQLERRSPNGTDVNIGLGVDGDALGMLEFPPDGFFVATNRGKLVHAMHGDGLAISALPLHAQGTLWGADAMDLWVGGAHGGLAHYASSDANVTGEWTTVAEAATAPTFTAIAGHAGDDMWGVDPQGGLLHFDGHGWSAEALPDLGNDDRRVVSIAAFRDREMIATTPNDVLWFDGTVWNVVRHHETFGALATHGNDVWVASSQGVEHWDGDVWTHVQAFATIGIATAGGNDAWFANFDGVWHFDGQTTTRIELGPDAPVAIGALSPGHALVAFADHVTPIVDGVPADELTTDITNISMMQVRGRADVWLGAPDGTVAHLDGKGFTAQWSGTRNLAVLFPIPHVTRVLAFGALDADPSDAGTTPTGAILAHD